MINNVVHKIVDHVDFKIKCQNVSYLNIYNYKLLRKLPHATSKIDFFTSDGIMLCIVIFLIKGKKIARKSPDFSSYFSDLFSFLNVNKRKVFFLGGKSSDIEKFVIRIKHKYPCINICGYQDGFNFEENQVIEEIQSKQVDTVIVGMGSPKQELFITNLRENGYNGSCYTCGALFGQTVSNEGDFYYPKFVNRCHFRWAFRIYKEPKLITRYLIQYPIGLIYLLIDNFRLTNIGNAHKE